jgi:hypothetical protein
MKIILSILTNICPMTASIYRQYLYIHHLSHYFEHTEEALSLLSNVDGTFWNILKNPQCLFSKWGLVEEDYTSPKLHYLMHYAQKLPLQVRSLRLQHVVHLAQASEESLPHKFRARRT